MGLRGKCALITGSPGGLGRIVAEHLRSFGRDETVYAPFGAISNRAVTEYLAVLDIAALGGRNAGRAEVRLAFRSAGSLDNRPPERPCSGALTR